MRKIGLLMIGTLAFLVAGAAWAGGPAVPAALPDELAAQLTPKPENKIAYVGGPCNIEITCIGDYTIGCSGLSYCMWRQDSFSPSFPSYRGFVECDGLRTTCTTIE